MCFRLTATSLIVVMTFSIHSSVTGAQDVAKAIKGDVGLLDSYAANAAEDAPTKREEGVESKETASFLFWKHRAVTHGRTLNVRATAISVYIPDCHWHYSRSTRSLITTPRGTGNRAGSGWMFPDANQHGIVIRQDGRYWQINGTSSSSPTRITGLTNTKGVEVFVNDTNGNLGDNWGAFDVRIRIDAN